MARYIPTPGGPINRERLQTVLDDLAQVGLTVISIGREWDGDILSVQRKLWHVKALAENAELLARQVLESVEHHEQ